MFYRTLTRNVFLSSRVARNDSTLVSHSIASHSRSGYDFVTSPGLATEMYPLPEWVFGRDGV